MKRRAVIVGSEGQDGRLLFDRLDELGYELVGIGRTASRCNYGMRFSAVNMLRSSNVEEFLADIAPDDLYYLAAAQNASDDASADSRSVLALTLDRSGKFIAATGIPHGVCDSVEVACEQLGLDAKTVVDAPSGSDSKHVRLVGNSSKIRRMTGWSPQVGFQEMIRKMIDDELARAVSTAKRSSGSP